MRDAIVRRRQRGQATVEFVLSVSVLFAAIYGLVDFGRALYTFDLVTSAARVGSRYAMVHGSACTLSICPASPSAIQSYVQSKMGGVINPSSLTVNATWTSAPGCSTSPYEGPQCVVKVTATYPFTWDLVFHSTLNMTSTSQVVISQ